MRINLLPALTAGVVLTFAIAVGGCASKEPSFKEKATVKWNTARAQVMAGLARDQFKTGSFDKARNSIEEGLKLDPNNPQLHVLSAKLSIEEGKLELAERELEVARKLSPADAEPFYLSGIIYQRWQKSQNAYEFYKAAGERAPAELAYLLAESEMLVALERVPDALALLKRKLAYFEQSPAIRDAIGQLLTRAGKYAEAVEMFRQAGILGEGDMAYRERLGLAQYYAKQYRDAADTLTVLIAIEPFDKRADLLTALAQCQLATGRSRDARDTFERAAMLDAGSVHIYMGLARAATECNDARRAELAIRKAEALAPKSAEPALLLGYLRLRQNKIPQALDAFKKAHTLDRNDTVSLCMIGFALQKSGREDLAIQYYGRALKVRPGDELASQLMAGVNPND